MSVVDFKVCLYLCERHKNIFTMKNSRPVTDAIVPYIVSWKDLWPIIF